MTNIKALTEEVRAQKFSHELHDADFESGWDHLLTSALHLIAALEASEIALGEARAEVVRLCAALAMMRTALERIANQPESYSSRRYSYGIGFAFHKIRAIARTALSNTDIEA